MTNDAPKEVPPNSAAVKTLSSVGELLGLVLQAGSKLILAGLLALALFGFSVEMFSGAAVVIQPVSVPKELADKGYTSEVVARRLIDKMEDLQLESAKELLYSNASQNPVPVRGASGNSIDFELPGSRISVKSMAKYAKDRLGRSDQSISGEIMQTKDGTPRISLRSGEPLASLDGASWWVDIRVVDGRWQILRSPSPDVETLAFKESNDSLDAILSLAAEEMLRALDPPAHAMLDYSRARNDSKGQANGEILFSWTKQLMLDLRRSPRKDYRSWSYVIEAKILNENEDYDGALQKLKTAEDLRPGMSYIFYLRGSIFEAQKKLADAEDQYRRAIRRDGQNAAARVALGSLLHHKELWRESLTQFLEAARYYPREPSLFNNICAAYRELKRFDEAAKNCKQATGIEPEYAIAYLNWGLCLTFWAESDLLHSASHNTEAIEMFRSATQVSHGAQGALTDSEALMAFENWSRLLKKLNKKKEADLVERAGAAWSKTSSGKGMTRLGEVGAILSKPVVRGLGN